MVKESRKNHQSSIGRSNGKRSNGLKLLWTPDAKDFKADENGFEILTEPATFEAVHKKIETAEAKMDPAEITLLPMMTVPLTDANAIAAGNKLIDALEEHNGVKEAFQTRIFEP